MQVGATPGNIDVAHTNSVNRTYREFSTMSDQTPTEVDTPMSDRAPADNATSESSSQCVTTRLRTKKRARPEDEDVEEGTTAKPLDLIALEHHPSVA